MRVAIIGGGIAGLTAAFALEQARRAGAGVDWQLFEAGNRFGGILETSYGATPEGAWVLEGGPDGWVAEKPWARELAEELGLGPEIVPCFEAERRTYLWQSGGLLPLPPKMRLMVPEDLGALAGSPLFSATALEAYTRERTRSDALRAAVPAEDESVASFVRRHFGDEVLAKVAAPLLSGVFGGDVERLSVRAVMPQFVAMEAEHGSLVLALERAAAARGARAPRPAFLSLRRGMGSLTEALGAALPPERLHAGTPVAALHAAGGGWQLEGTGAGGEGFKDVLLAVSARHAAALLAPHDQELAAQLPEEASSATLVCLGWRPEAARAIAVPPGFGFLVPALQGPGGNPATDRPRMLAATFVDQKFPSRVPVGGRLIRLFFGSALAPALGAATDAAVGELAKQELEKVLGPLPAPDPALLRVRHWPHSLPQYGVGHLQRAGAFAARLERLPGVHLLGSGLRGVGVPDLIREARDTVRALVVLQTKEVTAGQAVRAVD